MAKAHQQYYADEVYIQKQAREFSPTEELLNLAGGEENVIEEIRVNGVQLIPDQDKAVDITVPLVVDALDSTSTADALSAKQGKVLYDYIQNISARGRFLSNWNCATGLATTNPEESPYAYRAGDYFIVSNIAAVGGTNYRPSGASYVIGQASTDVETASVGVSDLYIYDGTNWILMSNGGGGSIAVDSSLSTTSTNPVENRVITNELNKKYYGVVSNSAPSTPTLGMIWYDTTSGNFKTYDGSGWVRKLDLGLNKVFDNSTVEIGKWAEEGGVQSSGHHVTIDPNGEVSTYNVTVAGHNEATLGSGTLELLSNTALGGDETLTIDHEQIVANDGTNTQIYSFFGNDRIAKLSDIGGGYSAGAGIDITNNVISADTTVLATKSDLDEKQDTLTAGSNITIGQVCESDMRGPAPSGFHIPTNTEWTGVRTMFSNLSLSYSAFSTNFHMPVMGIRGNSSGDTESGYTEYWSSVAASNSSEAYAFYLDSGSTAVTTEYRAKGFPIRAFKNSFEVPTSSWTVVTGTLGSAGIFRNQTDGLISITSNGTTGYTMMDKNIGATTVWSNGDAMSQTNCGNFFQWGNNYGFAFSGLLTTSSTQIDTTGYGPGNYYSDSTYIVGNSNRSSIDNKNLWGGVTQQDSICQSVISATDTTYTAGNGISIDANNEISNTLPGAIVSATAPSNPTEGMVWYDTTNDSLKAYNGTSWETEGTKMVVLEYGVSTWQDFLDAYNKNALVYCKVSSGSSGYRMAFMAYTAGTTTPTEVEFQYYRSRNSHSTAANQLDEVYVYKLTNAGVWTTTQRDTAAKAIAGTGIGLSFNSSGMTISADTTVLATQTDLNSKANKTDVNLKSFGTFPGSGLSDLQALYDWLAAGNYAEVTYDHMVWIFGPTNITTGEVESYYLDETPVDLPETGRITGKRTHIEFTVSDGTVTGAYGSSSDATSQVWGVRVNSVAPTIGIATNCFWYDTSTHKLKAWNGSSWDIVGDESADINTKTFYLPDTTGAAALAVAQEAVDWLLAGKNPIVKYSGYSYLCVAFDSQNSLFLVSPYYNVALENNSVSKIRARELDFSLNSNNEVTAITAADDRVTRVLSTDINYSTPYTPLYDGSPATKKYVDDSVNTKTFYLSGNLQSAESIAAAQAAYDWYLAGKNPIVKYGNNFLTCAGVWQDTIPATKYYLAFTSTRVGQLKDHSNPPLWAQAPNINNRELLLEFSNDTVTAITEDYTAPSFLPTNSSVEILYSPSYDWDPATKKYVDDRTTNVKVFSPASPMSNADALAIAEYTNNTGTAIIRYNGDEYFPAGTEDRSQPGVVYIDGTPTGYIYKTHPSDSSNVIKIIDITATIGLNSSSLDNISYSSMGVMLNNTTGTSSTISDQWVGTEAEYNLLSSYGADTIYFII